MKQKGNDTKVQDPQETLALTLGHYFPSVKSSSDVSWRHAAPLLVKIATDRQLIAGLQTQYDLDLKPGDALSRLGTFCTQFAAGILDEKEAIANPYYYRLPLILGEYPLHTKPINKAIQAFNQLIEHYHKNTDPQKTLDAMEINKRFLEIVNQLKAHGGHCCPESLADLISMMRGWSCISVEMEIKEEVKEIKSSHERIEKPEKSQLLEIELTPVARTTEDSPWIRTAPSPLMPRVIASKKPNKVTSAQPFIKQSAYQINSAGRFSLQNYMLVLNAFGLKFGGHSDGIQVNAPQLIPIMDFYSILCQELLQWMQLPKEEKEGSNVKVVLLTTLKKLGMEIESTNENSDLEENYIYPFSNQRQALMTPPHIKQMLTEFAKDQEYPLTDEDVSILSEHISHTLVRMLFNFSIALGIGANQDGTISFSNDARDYFYQFAKEESAWPELFAQLSRHRQGPAEAYMDASKGFAHELAAGFLTELEQMTQLQPSEYFDIIYRGLIDNTMSDLLPHPYFFENTRYQKYRKHHILVQDEKHQTKLVSYAKPSASGIFRTQESKNPSKSKQDDLVIVPAYKPPGMVDIFPFVREHPGICESSRGSSGNPLAEKQLQFAQAMQMGERGDYVYNPIGPDGFISDIYKGQVLKAEDGTYTILTGVMPKNFDKIFFDKDKELCASFVIHMLLSSNIEINCPTFSETRNRLMANFLPKASAIPDLPLTLRENETLEEQERLKRKVLQEKLEELRKSLVQSEEDDLERLNFKISLKRLTKLFKNIVYALRTTTIEDTRFLTYYHRLIKDPDFLSNPSRENFEKIIRTLRVNPPLKNELADPEYQSHVEYLQKLIDSFYPVPGEETAQKIQKNAKIYAKLLHQHPDVQSYFTQLASRPLANQSPMQSPRELFHTLQQGTDAAKDSSMETKRADLDRMHEVNFQASYRDSEGGMITTPDKLDQGLDYIIKGIAKFAAFLQHDEDPIGHAVISPFLGIYDSVSYLWSTADSKPKKFAALLLTLPAAALGATAGALSGGLKLLSYGVKLVARPFLNAGKVIKEKLSDAEDSKLAKAGVVISAIPGAANGFIDGVIDSVGHLLWDCSMAPLVRVYKSFQQRNKLLPIKEHPLLIPATPGNEPGLKVKKSNQVRDILVAAQATSSLTTDRFNLISRLQKQVKNIIKKAHPEFSENERLIAAEKIISVTVLNGQEWKQFFQPFSNTPINQLLTQYQDKISKNLLAAAYHCFLTTGHPVQALAKKHPLLPNQIQVLTELVNFFKRAPASEQEHLKALFAADGIIAQQLKQKDVLNHRLHDAVMQAFNGEKVKYALYEILKKQFMANPKIEITAEMVIKMPQAIQQKISKFNLKKEAPKFVEQKEAALTNIQQLEQELNEIKTNPISEETEQDEKDIAAITAEIQQFQTLSKDLEKNFLFDSALHQAMSSSTFPEIKFQQENEAIQSPKDKAHDACHRFLSRELAHKFLTENEIDKIFKCFTEIPAFEKNDLLRSFLEQFKASAKRLMTGTLQEEKYLSRRRNPIDDFYHLFLKLKSLMGFFQSPENFPQNLLTLLQDFVTVSMNAALNQILDQINYREEDEKTLQQIGNPLAKYKALGQWLTWVYQKKKDFWSLLAQQENCSLSPLICQANLRKVLIIHRLESAIKLRPEDRIRKTGLQKSLRIYFQEQNSVKKNGIPYHKKRIEIDSYLKKSGISSPTFNYASQRSQYKLGLFNPALPKKAPNLNLSCSPPDPNC